MSLKSFFLICSIILPIVHQYKTYTDFLQAMHINICDLISKFIGVLYWTRKGKEFYSNELSIQRKKLELENQNCVKKVGY